VQDVDAPTVPFAGGHHRRWRLLVPLTSLGAGLLFATTAVTAHGTDLWAGRRSQLTDLISSQRHQVDARERVAAGLRSAVAGATGRTAAGSTTVAGERRRAAALATAAGLTPLSGPSLTVSLDDAPRPSAGQRRSLSCWRRGPAPRPSTATRSGRLRATLRPGSHHVEA